MKAGEAIPSKSARIGGRNVCVKDLLSMNEWAKGFKLFRKQSCVSEIMLT